MITVLITGSREWTDEATMRAWLSRLPPGTRIVHGAAKGADMMADRIARELGFEVERYPVDEMIDGPWPMAGHRRNQRMLDAERERIRRGLAFSLQRPSRGDGRKRPTGGTLDCVGRMFHMGVAVTLVAPGARP